MKKFWNWIRDEVTGGRTLRLEGPIDEDDSWGDAITPKAFREDLEADSDDITVWINSPGGSVFAAAEIYTMLRDYVGSVTVKIASIAASAASVVAMAGDKVQMSPTALLFIHDPMTIAMGNSRDMEKAIATLNEVKESILNAYMAKTGLSHNRIAKLMENESWINAKEAVKLGFADEILFENKEAAPDEAPEQPDNEEQEAEGEEGKDVSLRAHLYSTRLMGRTILNRLAPIVDTAEHTAQNPSQGIPNEEGHEDAEPTEAQHTEEVTPDDEAEDPVEAVEEPQTEDESPTNSDPPVNEKPAHPVIGMDGKTEDGAMPFQILMNKLDCMK